MVVVTRQHLLQAMKRFPDAANDLRAWQTVVQAARWKSMADVVRTFKDADEVDGYTLFNIRHNRYRLITVIHYSKFKGGIETNGHVYIRSVLTHKEYDNRKNWDRRFGR
jgi:mRNA interferase HigB